MDCPSKSLDAAEVKPGDETNIYESSRMQEQLSKGQFYGMLLTCVPFEPRKGGASIVVSICNQAQF
jgi:hypothetical protein